MTPQTAPTTLDVLAAPSKFSLAFLLNDVDTESGGESRPLASHSDDSGGDAFSYDGDYEFGFGVDVITDQPFPDDGNTTHELREVNI